MIAVREYLDKATHKLINAQASVIEAYCKLFAEEIGEGSIKDYELVHEVGGTAHPIMTDHVERCDRYYLRKKDPPSTAIGATDERQVEFLRKLHSVQFQNYQRDLKALEERLKRAEEYARYLYTKSLWSRVKSWFYREARD